MYIIPGKAYEKFFVRRPYLDRIYRMDIFIYELAYLIRIWTEKQYRTKAYPYETQTLSTCYQQKPKQLY